MKKLFAILLPLLIILFASACQSGDTPGSSAGAESAHYEEYDSGNAVDWLHDLGLTESDIMLPDFTRFTMNTDNGAITGINIYSSSAQSPDAVKAWFEGIMGKLVSASDDGILYESDGVPLVTDDIDYGSDNVTVSGICSVSGKFSAFTITYTGSADTGEAGAPPTASFAVSPRG